MLFLTSCELYRAGPSLNAYNYESDYGKRALELLYSGILGEVSNFLLK